MDDDNDDDKGTECYICNKISAIVARCDLPVVRIFIFIIVVITTTVTIITTTIKTLGFSCFAQSPGCQ